MEISTQVYKVSYCFSYVHKMMLVFVFSLFLLTTQASTFQRRASMVSKPRFYTSVFVQFY